MPTDDEIADDVKGALRDIKKLTTRLAEVERAAWKPGLSVAANELRSAATGFVKNPGDRFTMTLLMDLADAFDAIAAGAQDAEPPVLAVDLTRINALREALR